MAIGGKIWRKGKTELLLKIVALIISDILIPDEKLCRKEKYQKSRKETPFIGIANNSCLQGGREDAMQKLSR